MRRGSDRAHRVAGGVLLVAAVLALAEAFGLSLPSWSALLVAFGGLFVVYMLVHHGLGELGRVATFVWNDAQQRQHLFLGVLLATGGLGALLDLPIVFALALAAIGLAFLGHAQHGTAEASAAAAKAHRRLGAVLVMAGLLRAFQVFAPDPAGPALGWPIALGAAAVLLLLYEEPPGAYEPTSHPQH